jgi:hypothetical protein
MCDDSPLLRHVEGGLEVETKAEATYAVLVIVTTAKWTSHGSVRLNAKRAP